MADEFAGLGRLKTLKEDAKRTAAEIKAAAQVETETASTVVEISRPVSPRGTESATLQDLPRQPAVTPVSLSTLVLAATKKRLARAAHLQAASDQSPNTQWEIVDQAVNEWCKKRGY